MNAQIGGVIGQNAVENNYLSLKDVNDLRAELRAAKTEEEKERIFEKYRKKGESKSQALRESCRGKGDECHLNAIAELRNTNQAARPLLTMVCCCR
ncbi:VENN motif pre-toxin domain-containing protein [Neisseria sp.]|uniref:VENN motif pre-toxin domain-containing protein n=1 Tax=Neisseria sp. TaxID=192066 RepID=UPI00391751AE